MCITESPCYTVETGTTLQISYTAVKQLNEKEKCFKKRYCFLLINGQKILRFLSLSKSNISLTNEFEFTVLEDSVNENWCQLKE